MPHLIPSVALTPILVRCTGLRHQTRIKRDISSDYLATDEEMPARKSGRPPKGVSICEDENVVFDYHEEDTEAVDYDEEDTSSSSLDDDYTARVSTYAIFIFI